MRYHRLLSEFDKDVVSLKFVQSKFVQGVASYKDVTLTKFDQSMCNLSEVDC